MLKIRLARVGKRNEPHFRIVLSDHKRAVQKRYIEILGSYHPAYKNQEKQLVINKERVKYWHSKGAQFSDAVEDIVVREKILELPKRKFFPKKKKQEEAKKAEVAAAPADATAPEASEAKPAEAAAAPKAEAKAESPKEEKK